MKRMKRTAALLLAALTLFALCVRAAGEAETWICPYCGSNASGNFCADCGARRPADGAWVCPVCGRENTGNFCPDCGTARPEAASGTAEDAVRLDVRVEFEKNAYFSTYDVKLYIDGEWVATLRHGTDYAGTFHVAPGRHTVLFRAENYGSAEGSTVINIGASSLFSCAIRAKSDAVQIKNERIDPLPDGLPEADETAAEPVPVNGNIRLRLFVEFKKNAFFSTYDVNVYMDGLPIASLPHGKNLDAVLLVSEGAHVLAFYKSGSGSVMGTISFSLDRDADYSCRIEAEHDGIRVLNGKLTY